MSYISHVKVDNITYDIKDKTVKNIQLTTEDLNDIRPPDTTWYYGAGGNTVNNKPTGTSSFGLLVFKEASGYYRQIFFATKSFIFSRSYGNSTWTEWKKFPTQDDITNAFKANDAMLFKGTIGSSNASVTTLPTTHYQGWTYKVATADTYAGYNCEPGDMIICVAEDGEDTDWTVVQTNMTYGGPPSNLDLSASTGVSTMVARADHVHKKPDLGNITYKGEISVTTEIANGDKILISDSSDNNIIKNSSINFDGSSEDKALTPKGTWGDFYTEPEIDEKLDEKENIIIKNASGSIAHFEDAAEGNAINVKVDFEPKQDLHGYNHPWPTGGGNNLINLNEMAAVGSGTSISIEENKVIINKPSGAVAWPGARYGGNSNLLFLPGTYYIKMEIEEGAVFGDNALFGFRNPTGSFISGSMHLNTSTLTYSGTKTINEPCYFSIVLNGTSSNDPNYYDQACNLTIKNLIVSTTNVPYEPYENICPIEGYTGCNITKIGKNLLKNTNTSQTINDVTFTINQDGSVTVNGTASASIEYIYQDYYFTQRKDYILTGCPSNGSTSTFRQIVRYRKQGIGNLQTVSDTGTDQGLSINSNTQPESDYIRIGIYITSGYTANNLVFKPMLRLASDLDNTYEPYTETIYPISWESKAGMVYTGNLNITTGKLIITHSKVELQNLLALSGQSAWLKSSSALNGFYISKERWEFISPPNSEVLSSHFKTVNSTNEYWNTYNTIYHSSSLSFNCDPAICGNTVENWEQWLINQKKAGTPVELWYELFNPITYQLTPTEINTFLGTNNIWCNIGNISIDYLVESSDKLAKYLSNKLSFDNIPTNNSYNPVYSNGIKTALNDKADNIIKNISGNPVIITDGSIAPVNDLTVEIKPIQDLHGLNNPYPAGGGNNSWVQITPGTYTNGGITVVVNENNLVTVTGTKNTDSSVTIEMPYQISGTIGKINYYLHMRNTAVFANTEVYFNIVNPTTTKVYFNAINRILQNTADREFQSCGLVFTSSVPSGTEFNFTFQPSLENTDVVTEWTPYSNICPIVGWTGCNIVKSRVFTPNQFINNGNFQSTSGWSALRSTIYIENNTIKIQGKNSELTSNGMYQNQKSYTAHAIGHVFFVTCDAKADVTNIKFSIGLDYGTTADNVVYPLSFLSTSWQTYNGITKFVEPNSSYGFGFRFICTQNKIPDDSYAYVKNVMIIDLTEMFGEQVAEQILAMEQAKSGSGVAVVKGFFPEDYYPTNNTVSDENDGQGSLYSITFPTEVGTVYGGSLDVTTGVLTVNRIIRQVLPTFNWQLGTNTNPNGTGFYAENIMSDCINWQNSICNIFAVGSGVQGSTPNNTFWFVESNGTLRIFWGLPNKGSTVEEFTAFLQANPTYICAELATPITYQLTSIEVTTLLGENVISADTGNINVSYRADTKTYIDNIKSSAENSENAIQSMITQSFENDIIATRNYNTGDLLIINNQLLKATEQIYMGSSISGKTSVVDLETIIGEKLDLHGIADSSNSVISIQLTNENLNDLLSENTTWYYASSNNSVTNSPLSTGTAFDLIVYRSASYRKQLLSASVSNIWYERIYQGTKGWTEWEKINYELPIASNDILGGIKVGQNLTIDDTGELSSHESGIIKTTSGNPVIIPDGVYAPVADLTVNIEPIQNLHGLPNPYPAGGGKNLLKMTVDEIKAINDAGTWTDNSYLNYGVTFTLQLDNDGNVIGITATGISTNNNCDIRILIPSDVERELIVSGGPTTDANAYIYCYDTTNNRRINDWNGNTTDNSKNGSTINIKPTLNSVSQLRCRVLPASEVNNLLYKPMARLRTITDDTFEPSTNICPITGWTGCNIIRNGKNFIESVPVTVEKYGVTAVVNNDGTITLNGICNTAQVIIFNLADPSAGNSRQCDNKKHLPNGIYRKMPAGRDVGWYLQIIGTNTENAGSTDPITTISGVSANVFTIDDTYKYNYIRLYIYENATFDNETIYPWIYKSDEVAEYPITFPTEAGTVYGGSLDVMTGVLTVTHEKYEVQNLESILNKTWAKSTLATNAFWITATGITNKNTKFSSSHFEYTNQTSTYQENYGYCYHDSSLAFNCDPAICGTTVESWKTWLTTQKTLGTPVEIVIELTTPQTYQLTPIEILTLLGNNTISADIGIVNVTYQANIKNYIDEGLNEKLSLTGGTLTGDLTIYKESDTNTNAPARIVFKPKDTTTNKVYSNAYIAVYNDHNSTAANGTNMVLQSGGNLFIGSGESPKNLYTSKTTDSSESLYITSDTVMHIQGGAGTIANRVGMQISTAGSLLPEKADTLVDNSGNIGGVNNRWANLYVTNINSTTLNVTDINNTNLEAININSNIYKINNQATIQWNESDESLDFIFT